MAEQETRSERARHRGSTAACTEPIVNTRARRDTNANNDNGQADPEEEVSSLSRRLTSRPSTTLPLLHRTGAMASSLPRPRCR